MKRHILWTALFVLAAFGLAQAQGMQTGTISGTAKSPDGLAFPGVTVSVKSPALQGVRTATTDQNGNYIFKALPPGTYLVTFQVAGMQTLEKTAELELGRSITVDGTLQVGGVTETVTVTETLPGIVETASGGANYKATEIDTLPTGRTVAAIAALAPGLTTNTPNAGQLTISGAFAYDNVFLVDGVDVNDNVFGTANNLFIEDAIEEQAVITSGISAEYGRFGGGIINTITKRGGNTFQGSLRANFTNSAWQMETPYEKENKITHDSKLNKTFEATLGGPILKDRLWFFLAGRSEKTDTGGAYPDLGAPVTSTNDNKRLIAKLTGTIVKNHTLTGTYTYNNTKQGNASFSTTASSGTRSIDPRDLLHARAAQQPVRDQLQRRPHLEPVRGGPVLAEEVPVQERGRHGHQPDQRLALLHDGHLQRHRRRRPLQRPVLGRHRPRGPRQPPGLRGSVLLPVHGQARPPRHQGRLRELPQHPHRRQLADADRLRVLRRLRHGRRRQARARRTAATSRSG